MSKTLIIKNFIERTFLLVVRVTRHFLHGIAMRIGAISRFKHVAKTSEEKKNVGVVSEGRSTLRRSVERGENVGPEC